MTANALPNEGNYEGAGFYVVCIYHEVGPFKSLEATYRGLSAILDLGVCTLDHEIRRYESYRETRAYAGGRFTMKGHDDMTRTERLAATESLTAVISGLAREWAKSPDGGTVRVAYRKVMRLKDPADYPARYVVGGVIAPATAYPGISNALSALVDLTSRIPSQCAVGWWIDDNGVTVWDVVDFHDDLTAALDIAADRGEIAVWDSAESVEIRIGG